MSNWLKTRKPSIQGPWKDVSWDRSIKVHTTHIAELLHASMRARVSQDPTSVKFCLFYSTAENGQCYHDGAACPPSYLAVRVPGPLRSLPASSSLAR